MGDPALTNLLMHPIKLFYNYSIDCELPPDGIFGGPATWEVAEASTRGFIEVMEQWGLIHGATLFVYPDVAMKQHNLYREMAKHGIEIGLHIHGMRYSRVKKPAWLGSLGYDDQREIIRMAKQDLEDVIGKPCLGYRACYASANHFTYPIIQELGFQWASTSASGSYKPEIYARWAGGWPFPYHPSRKNMLIPGDLAVYEITLTRGLHTFFMGNPDRPLDMRAETPPEIVGSDGKNFRRIIEENLVEMDRVDQPVRVIIGASHNTNPYADPLSYQHKNLWHVCHLVRELCQTRGYEFIPASFLQIKQEADRVDAF
jgi:hypothetical protein